MTTQSNTNSDAVESDVMALRHEMLIARDRIAGLEAELSTLHARLELIDATDIGRAFARVDELEDERQAMMHELRWTISTQRKVVEDYRVALEGVQRSVPFRLGNMLVSPARRVVRFVRK